MEFLSSNYLDTTTLLTLPDATAAGENLLRRDTRFQWVTENFGNDLTTASLTISFTSTLTVSRIGMLGHNIRGATIFYNGATANTFSLTTTAGVLLTTTSDFTGLSGSSHYFRAAAVACTSVTFDLKTTQVADSQKAIGYLLLTDTELVPSRITNAKGFKPVIDAKQVTHELSDGGTRIQTIDKKFMFNLSFTNFDEDQLSSLRTLYDANSEFCFVPEGTATGWDGIWAPVVWEGNFDFYQYADNNPSAGRVGKMKLREVPS